VRRRHVVIVVILAMGPPAGAETRCATKLRVAGDPVGEVRLASLRADFHHRARAAAAWHATWSLAYGGVSIYQGVALASADHDARIDRAFGLGASLLGFAVLQIMPMHVLYDHRRVEALATRDGEVCARLAEAERLLVREVGSEKFAKSPLVHVGNFVVNAALLIGLGAGFRHWDAAALAGGIGVVVGEVQIISQPTGARRALDRYLRGELAHF
jgi:hypothetical protein